MLSRRRKYVRNSLQLLSVEKPNFCQKSLDESLTPWNNSESELISITENIKYEVIEENDCDSFYKTKSVRNNSKLRDPLTVVENTEDTEKYDDNFKNDCCSNEFSKVINCDLETYDYKDYELKHDHEKALKSEVKDTFRRGSILRCLSQQLTDVVLCFLSFRVNFFSHC